MHSSDTGATPRTSLLHMPQISPGLISPSNTRSLTTFHLLDCVLSPPGGMPAILLYGGVRGASRSHLVNS
jgi:hypothetical protein